MCKGSVCQPHMINSMFSLCACDRSHALHTSTVLLLFEREGGKERMGIGKLEIRGGVG